MDRVTVLHKALEIAETRASDALANGDMVEHHHWARAYHGLADTIADATGSDPRPEA